MNAKEMFEKLDWIFVRSNDDVIVYRQNAFRLTILKGIYNFKLIYIDNENKEVCGWVDMPLMNAIHQQMKELGWIDEN